MAPMDPNKIIDDLGGTTAVAKICNVKPASVSQWRSDGIPEARLMYLKLLHPEVFEDTDHQQDDKRAA